MKMRTIWVALILAFVFLLIPSAVSAGTLNEHGTRSVLVGENHVTWDSNFMMKDYIPGTPVTLQIDWKGTNRVTGLISMGLGEKKFTPAGTLGKIVGIQRVGSNSALVTVEFLEFARQGVANVHLKMNLGVDDGTGQFQMRSFDVDFHVNEANSSAAAKAKKR